MDTPVWSAPDLLQQRDDLRRQLAEVRAILAVLLDNWTRFDDGRQDEQCVWCDEWQEFNPFRPMARHKPDCPVLKRDALLGRTPQETDQ